MQRLAEQGDGCLQCRMIEKLVIRAKKDGWKASFQQEQTPAEVRMFYLDLATSNASVDGCPSNKCSREAPKVKLRRQSARHVLNEPFA
jgi:hypothetical protein